MPRFRPIIAILCALAWCSAVLHADLEAAGWLLEHEHHTGQSHHHEHHEQPGHHQPAADDTGHETVVARTHGPESGLPVPSFGPALLPVLGFPSGRQRLLDCEIKRWVPRPAEPELRSRWQFLWRCAPESAAPPIRG